MSLSLKEALSLLRDGKPCTIEACSLDIDRNIGGERIVLQNVTLSGSSSANPLTSEHLKVVSSDPIKNPWHRENLTLNFRHKSGEYTKVHIPLLESINGKQILL